MLLDRVVWLDGKVKRVSVDVYPKLLSGLEEMSVCCIKFPMDVVGVGS